MTHANRLASLALAVLLAGTALGAPPALAKSRGETNWDAMKTCASLDDAQARHVCTDAVLRSAGLLGAPAETAAGAAAEPPKTAAQPTAPAPTPTAPRQAETLSPAEREAFYPREEVAEDPSGDVDRIELTLSKASKTGDGRLVLTASDGMTWRQLYHRSMMPIPRAGSSMSVRKGAMNGYMCTVDNAPPFRCKPSS